MPRLVPGMRVFNKKAGLKHKENGNALLLLIVDDNGGGYASNRVLVRADGNRSYYWWKYNTTFPAINQPDLSNASDVPSNAHNQATKNMNASKKRAYDNERFLD